MSKPETHKQVKVCTLAAIHGAAEAIVENAISALLASPSDIVQILREIEENAQYIARVTKD